MRKSLGLILGGLFAFTLAGCAKPFSVPDAGSDYALIADHMIEGTGAFDYNLVEIDGRPITRERVPFGTDMMPRAVASIGPHTFKVLVSPHRRPPDNVPRPKVFTATVEGGRTYFVGTSEGLPVLMEQR